MALKDMDVLIQEHFAFNAHNSQDHHIRVKKHTIVQQARMMGVKTQPQEEGLVQAQQLVEIALKTQKKVLA
ncbi:MAG TPA: hypothetical protein DEF27_03460 [Oscillatoriales bacterium UBA8482]|nr:hypothetical protein [Oscillatoriales bacterium UBA8482]